MQTETVIDTTTISVEDVREAMAQFLALRKKMIFLLLLTEAERAEYRGSGVGAKKLRILNNRLTAARKHSELLPPAFDLKKFEHNAALTVALNECLTVVTEIEDALSDTLLVVGSRALNAASTVAGHLTVGSNNEDRLERTMEKITSHPSRKEREPDPVPVVSEPSTTDGPVQITGTDKAA